MKTRLMTQRELASRINATEAAVSKYVNSDRTPRADIVADIANALETTSDYLLGRTIEPKADFKAMKIIMARGASKLTSEEKAELVRILFKE
ncbi:MAG: helix-turn-helix transcriptional regulator [Victivallales bacterium]|nr:helix-turn-helix transcriptional regulator [Victivallales bacterium]